MSWKMNMIVVVAVMMAAPSVAMGQASCSATAPVAYNTAACDAPGWDVCALSSGVIYCTGGDGDDHIVVISVSNDPFAWGTVTDAGTPYPFCCDYNTMGDDTYDLDIVLDTGADELCLHDSSHGACADDITGDQWWPNDSKIDGDAGADNISTARNGGAIVDDVDGGAGNDTIITWAGDDVIDGEGDNDTIDGRNGADTISGGPQNDTIYGGAGDDIISGGDGADTIYGGADDDTIDGDAASDSIYGEAGADTINGGAGNDSILYGGLGVDDVCGGTGADSVHGNDTGGDCACGGDTVTPNDLAVDYVYGDAGAADTCEGESDIDILDDSCETKNWNVCNCGC